MMAGINSSCTTDVSHQEYSRKQAIHIARPYYFRYLPWELRALSSELGEILPGRDETGRESSLRGQIKVVLLDHGISVFPPLNFKLEEPPHLLVISPREKIQYLDRFLLRQEIATEDMEEIEFRIDELGVSSLVVELGGFGATYPPIVTDDAKLTYIIAAVVEEWCHQYLAFRPLGFRYVLDSVGIRQHPDVIIINETLAGMISREIGSEVYERYYGGREENTADKELKEFDFDAEMRATRRSVDEYLAQGNIEEAERYMEERRQVFLAHGYQIRKLNQAYFAFHGIYGHDPSSTSPVYDDLKQLRAQSASLKEFLDTTSSITSYAELQEALGD